MYNNLNGLDLMLAIDELITKDEKILQFGYCNLCHNKRYVNPGALIKVFCHV